MGLRPAIQFENRTAAARNLPHSAFPASNSIKLELAGSAIVSPQQMIAKQAKMANARQKSWFSSEIELWFALSSQAHTAYRAPVGHGRFAGTDSSLIFLIPRRRRDG
jgi:hypothetical protein